MFFPIRKGSRRGIFYFSKRSVVKMNVQELKEALDKEKVHPVYYSLNGLDNPNYNDIFILDKPFTKWFIYYYERGSKHDIHSFTTEDSACRFLLERLTRDPLTRIYNPPKNKN